MTTEIRMPQLGESLTEGTVGRWLKQPGDAITKFEPLFEVTTDKVDSEIPSPASGTLLEILIPEGETVAVGTLLARMESVDTEPVVTQTQPTTASPPAIDEEPPRRYEGPVSPVVARMVAEHRLDINQIPGSGIGGRISKQDVLRYLEQHGMTAPAQEFVDPKATALPQQPSEPAATGSTVRLPAEGQVMPLSIMRRQIAEHMSQSVRTAPHATSVIEVDMSRVVAHHQQQRNEFARQGVKLTYTVYFVHAIATALRQVPLLIARYSDAGIIINQRVHIGVATALDDGLIVPVIHDADEKNLLGIARALEDLTSRAHTRKLRPEDVQGGTFTISNYGSGPGKTLIGTPIINQPQSGIIGVGAIVKRPVVISQDGTDAITIRSMCYLSLTFDHRLIDGSVADTFLSMVRLALEQYR